VNQLTLFLGSLAAILVLAGAAWALRLGGGAIAGEAMAMAEAEAMLSGFDAERAVVGSDGQAALVLGTDGSAALLKVHGTQVAARRLYPPLASEATPEGLRIATGEARFGAVTIRGVDAIPSAR
jgi:hypothetical protein